MKTIFMGTPDFAVVCLEKIIEDGHQIPLVITQPDKARDRGKKIQFPPVKECALRHKIDVLQPEKVKGNNDLIDRLNSLKPDIIVVVAYGRIIPREILECPRYGCINVHASLLPRLRGASPIQNAILQGYKETGVTIMQMGEGLDTGDMISKSVVTIGKMNFEELHDKLAQTGAELLSKTLTDIQNDNIAPVKQEDSLSTYAGLISKKDGHIDFTKDPESSECKIRAFDPWPGAYALYNENDEMMKFWKAECSSESYPDAVYGEVTDVDGNSFTIKCGNGALIIKEIQIPGKKRCAVSDYLRGHSIDKGFIFR